MVKVVAAALGILAILILPAYQDQGAVPEPSRKEIDEAIRKGADYLVKLYPKGVPTANLEFELVVYTLIHAELDPRKVEPLKKGIDDLITYPVPAKDQGTYRKAIRALALHSLLVKIKNNTYYRHLNDRVNAIQKAVAEVGQYLVDSQLDSGQWGYAGALVNAPVVSAIATGAPPPQSKFNQTASRAAWENASGLTGTLYKLVPKFGADPKDKKTDLGEPVTPGKQRGDNSNSQYAVLGLIAAEMSGVEVPRTTWELVLKWFEGAQNKDGGFGYGEGDGGRETQIGRYGMMYRPPVVSYGSMTTAGAVALAAAYKYLGKDYKNEKRFQSALQWLETNYSVTENPLKKSLFYLYFMYGLERVGAFSGVKTLGTHNWYAEGASQLLKMQKPDGAWPAAQHEPEPISTSFAVLFLKRATSDMIDSGGGIDAR